MSSLSVFSFISAQVLGPPRAQGRPSPGPCFVVFVLRCVEDACKTALAETWEDAASPWICEEGV